MRAVRAAISSSIGPRSRISDRSTTFECVWCSGSIWASSTSYWRSGCSPRSNTIESPWRGCCRASHRRCLNPQGRRPPIPFHRLPHYRHRSPSLGRRCRTRRRPFHRRKCLRSASSILRQENRLPSSPQENGQRVALLRHSATRRLGHRGVTWWMRSWISAPFA